MTRPMIEWTYHYNDATGTVMATTRMGAQEAAGKTLGISHRKNYLVRVTRIKPVVVRKYPDLPKSYMVGTLVSYPDGAATVHLHFGNIQEANDWFYNLTKHWETLK